MTMDVPTAVRDAREEFLDRDGIDDPADINAGACEEFADSVADRLPDDAVDVFDTGDITGQSGEPEPWHVWLFDGERHYDAETPSGVESWSELPFFGRVVTKEPRL